MGRPMSLINWSPSNWKSWSWKTGAWEEASAAGSGLVESGDSVVRGSGTIKLARAGSTAGADVGRRGPRFDPRWVEDAWDQALRKTGHGVVASRNPGVSGAGSVVAVSVRGGGTVVAATPVLAGHGRVSARVMVGGGGVVYRPAEVSGRAEVIDAELEMLCMMLAVSHG